MVEKYKSERNVLANKIKKIYSFLKHMQVSEDILKKYLNPMDVNSMIKKITADSKDLILVAQNPATPKQGEIAAMLLELRSKELKPQTSNSNSMFKAKSDKSKNDTHNPMAPGNH